MPDGFASLSPVVFMPLPSVALLIGQAAAAGTGSFWLGISTSFRSHLLSLSQDWHHIGCWPASAVPAPTPLTNVRRESFMWCPPVQVCRYAGCRAARHTERPGASTTSVAQQIHTASTGASPGSIVGDEVAQLLAWLLVRHQAVEDVLRRLIVGDRFLADIDRDRVDLAVEIVVAHQVVLGDRRGQVAPDVQRLVE
jgi:hypothetical protein